MLSQFKHILFEIYSELFQIYLKLSPLMRNYLVEQKRSLDGKLSSRARKVPCWEIILQRKRSISFIIWNQISWCEIILVSKKRITFMLLIIDKCLMTLKLRSKGRNPNIKPWTRTPWKRWRIILVVVCKRTFLEVVVWLLRF
jgi:hypothetical protein